MKGAHSHLKAYTALLIVLIIALGFIYGLYEFFGTPQSSSQPAAQATEQQ